jgi:hypothetical protein
VSVGELSAELDRRKRELSRLATLRDRLDAEIQAIQSLAAVGHP